MKTKTFIIAITALILVAGGTMLLGNNKENQISNDKERITVFYSPVCGCCSNYVAYLRRRGYKVETVWQTDLSGIRAEYGVPFHLASCHTSVVANYVVEGHIPVEVIQRLLAEKPVIAGVALAGMPSGSPGMAGAKLAPFRIHVIATDGGDGGIFTEF